MRPDLLSGAQYVLRAGRYTAAIASVGATLRSLTYDGEDVVVPFAADTMRPAMRGALLVPWPNRLEDGRYTFDGEIHQLAINEIDTNNASHGLIAWCDFVATHETPSEVTLRGFIQPQPGYPWRVSLDVTFTLTAHGLNQEVRATNLTSRPAPYGIGGHPYLIADTVALGAIDNATLEIPAGEVLLVSGDRLLPTSLEHVRSVAGREFDFTAERSLRGAVVNHAFTTVDWDEDGRARAVLRGMKRTVELEWDRRCPWVQVYTSDLPGHDAHRQAIAIEPMTCPPNAFNSGTDLQVLKPGAVADVGWTIRVRCDR